MINVQQAVANAKKTIRELDEEEQFRDLRVEEVTLSEEENAWLVTLGYFRKRDMSYAFKGLGLIQEDKGASWENRVYKELVIDAETGNFKGMKIRKVEG